MSFVQITLYLNSVHRFMARNKNVKVKLKLMKIFDVIQTENPLSYTILGGFLNLDMALIPTVLLESVAFTLLLCSFAYYYRIVW